MLLNFFIKILVVFVAGAFIYAGVPFFAGQEQSFEKRIQQILKNRRIEEEKLQFVLRPKKDYSAFLAELGNREIFAYPQISEAPVSEQGVDWQKVNKIVENLRLVGIISMEPKKAVIEDKSAGRTFNLQEGDEFLENIKVDNIMKDSVTISCYGKSFELHL